MSLIESIAEDDALPRTPKGFASVALSELSDGLHVPVAVNNVEDKT